MAGVTNLTEAMEIHDENYGPTYGVVPKNAEASPEFKNAMVYGKSRSEKFMDLLKNFKNDILRL